MKRSLVLGCFLACLALVSTAIIAQDKKADDMKPAAQKPSDAEMQKMMQDYMKNVAAPGPEHRQIKNFAGDWEIAGKFRMDPNAPWTDSKSTSHAELILGGRFVIQKIKGQPMPEMGMNEPFEGFGMIGFDRDKKKYISTWADNMGTMIMTAEGDASEGAHTISFTSHYQCPMRHKATWMRTVYKIEGPDKYILQMYGPNDTDGKEFLSGELVHTRKK